MPDSPFFDNYTPEPPPPPPEPPPPPKTEKEDLLDKIKQALADHNFMESNIGINHDYWIWIARIRALAGRP